MSEHKNLPDELVACEAKLAAMRLPPSQIDRDQLMFRAGYAAGKVKSSGGAGSSALPAGTASDAKRFGPLGVLSWSAASAAVAATIAVAITLELGVDEQMAAHVNEPSQPVDIETADDANQVEQIESRSPAERALLASERWLELPTDSVLSVGGARLGWQWQTLRQPVAASRGDVTSTSAKSHRELLEELLPPREPSDQESDNLPFWRLWNASSEGVAI